MLRRVQTLLLLLLLAQFAGADDTSDAAAREAILTKLKSVDIPLVEFLDLPLNEALRQLERESGVKITLRLPNPGETGNPANDLGFDDSTANGPPIETSKRRRLR